MKRPLWIVIGAQLTAAAALWGSSRLTWATETRSRPGTDTSSVVELTGADLRPLVPLAVLSLASVAAVVAAGGWPRRVLGVLLGAIGALSIVLGFAGVPGDAGVSVGRTLAVGAGALLIMAGALLIRYASALPKLGATYQRTTAENRSNDSDQEMWQALSLGRDPTTDDL